MLGGAVEHLVVGGRLVSYGGAAGEPDPTPPAFATLRSGNQTVTGFSVLRLARTAPLRARELIADTLARVVHGLPLTQPSVVGWDGLTDAHLRQSEGRTVGKVVLDVSRG
ncbi:MAG TPA: hypothetical protein VLS51_12410 [Propionibacteriaceae bacterium]|nr:hypothetical protein [Propionibacteriaceae bacterium]